MPLQLNQAHLEFKQGVRDGKSKVTLDRGKTVEWLNVYSNKPGAKLELKVTDEWGNEVISRKVDTGDTKNFGERISLELSDSYYNVEVKNLEGAEEVDVFLD